MPAMSAANRGHSLSRSRHEKGRVLALPAATLHAQLDMPDNPATASRGALPALVPAMSAYTLPESTAPEQRSGRSWAVRFFSNFYGGASDTSNDATMQGSDAAPALWPLVPLPATNERSRVSKQRKLQQKPLMRPSRHKVAPEGADTDDWRPLFHQKVHEVRRRKGEGALTVGRLQELTWDAILDHAENRLSRK